MSQLQFIQTAQHKADGACANCLRQGECLGASLQSLSGSALAVDELHVLHLPRGKTLYRGGETASAVFIVQSGALKLRRYSAQGDEEIVAFHVPGDTSGLDALGSGAYTREAVALGPTKVCRIPLASLRQALLRSPAMADRLFREIGHEFDHLQQRLQLERLSAPARLASYLLSQLMHRQALFGSAIDTITLQMSRIDLGRYLGLAAETVSRIFARLQQEGMISSEGQRVSVLNAVALRACAENEIARAPLARAA